MKRLAVGDVELAVIDEGAGMPVLLVHGFPLNHRMWESQIDALRDAYRVIAPDLRGFGESQVTGGTVTMAQYADDMAGLLDALGLQEPVVFCGLSMGGYVAWEFWARHGARTRAMILCDTRAAADAPEAAENRLAMAERVKREGTGFVAEGMLPKLLAEAAFQGRPELVARLREMIEAADPAGVAAAQRGMAERIDATPLLGGITCPVLGVVGEHDALSPVDEMRRMIESMPRAELVAIAEAGHMAPMENAAAVNGAIQQFLSRLAGPQ